MARRSKSRSRSPSRKEIHSHYHRSRHSSRDRRDNYYRNSDRNKKHIRDRSEADSPLYRSGNSRRSAVESRRSRKSRSRSPRRYERSVSPRRRRRSRSNSREKSLKGGAVPTFLLQRPEITDKDLEGKTEEEQEMLKLMGFGGFDSTKGKHVPGNDVSAVHVIHKRKYRQYMNRKGGFNRPLDFVA